MWVRPFRDDHAESWLSGRDTLHYLTTMRGVEMGRRRFELRLRPPEGRRIPGYPTGPHAKEGRRVF